jgi:hypothetical protein
MSGINWEKSKALTSLKHDLLTALFRYSRDFFLTGGSALGIFYLEHRRSYDLDLFSTHDIDWHKLSNDIACVAKEIGAEIKPLTTSITFRRYCATRGTEQEILDFVREMVPQSEPAKNEIDGILVDTLGEITINKWCALLGRAEIKDIIDLYFLSRRVDIWKLFNEAKSKDGGMDPSIMSYLISQIAIIEMPDYMIAPLSLDTLKAFIEEMRLFFDKQSFPMI